MLEYAAILLLLKKRRKPLTEIEEDSESKPVRVSCKNVNISSSHHQVHFLIFCTIQLLNHLPTVQWESPEENGRASLLHSPEETGHAALLEHQGHQGQSGIEEQRKVG